MSQKYLSVEDVREILKEQIKEAGNAAQWAFENCYSKAYVSYITNGHKLPSKRMLDDLGLKGVTLYVKKEGSDVPSSQ
jgi:hypothetical protein